jgi:glycosyltransferase involved in cell wall biosynthesis
MSSPQVSLGVPVYNGQKYLRRALDSLLNQDFKDFEIIISDNASTDETEDISRHYAALDGRIRYHRNEANIGSAPNYRRVFELARGEFFKWCAHDDLCFPTFLTRCTALLQSAPRNVVLAYPRCEFIDEDGAVLPWASDRLESRARQPHRRLGKVLRRVSHGGPLWGLTRADALRRTQLTGPVSYWDDLLLAELSLLGELWEIPEVLFQVRSYGGNAVAVAAAGQAAEVLRDPAKASRKTRQALRAWTDPSKANRRVWLPIRAERCLEYLKRVRGAPLGAVDRVRCYATVPVVVYWGRVAKIGGAWRRRLS